MRNLKEKTKSLSFICAIGITIIASSCNKDEDKDDAPKTNSKVIVVNAAPNGTALDLIIDN